MLIAKDSVNKCIIKPTTKELMGMSIAVGLAIAGKLVIYDKGLYFKGLDYP